MIVCVGFWGVCSFIESKGVGVALVDWLNLAERKESLLVIALLVAVSLAFVILLLV